MKEAVHVDGRHADGWLGRCRPGKSGRSDCSYRSGLVWLLRFPGSFPEAFLPEVGPTRVLKGRDDRVDGVALSLTVSSMFRPLVVVNVAGTEGLLERVFKTFLWCPSVTVASGEFTIRGYLGQATPTPFWKHALPSVAVASATWPLCLWFLPDQGPQHWRRSYSSEYREWCRDSADGSAQGIVDGGGRLPMT